MAYNFGDKVFADGTDRKISAGITHAPRNGKYVAFLGIGVRLFKYTFTNPELSESFLADLNENYTAVPQAGFDSLVGAAMNGGYFSGSTGAWIHTSFTLINKYRPTLSFYFGTKGISSYGPGYVHYTDPECNDIEYAILPTRFYEIKSALAHHF